MSSVNYQDLLDAYGGCSAAARALGYRKQTVHKWKGAGIPEEHQLEIHQRSKGKLKADAPILAKYRAILRAA